MNPTLNQIRNLNTQESEQMRRYTRKVLNRIKPKRKDKKNEQGRNPS